MKKLCMVWLWLCCCLSASNALALSPPMDECNSDADCPARSECVRSAVTCVEWPEPGQEVCFSNMICSDVVPTTCVSDADCVQGEICAPDENAPVCDCAFIDENGDGINDVDCVCPAPEMICQKPSMPDMCQSNLDCADDEYCYIDPNTPVCACEGCPCAIPTGMCLPGRAQCTSDADCSRGEICAPDADEPVCDCAIDENGDPSTCGCPPPTLICQPQQGPRHCDDDSQCRPGEACVVPAVDCVCPQGADCDCPAPRGICEDNGGFECHGNADCGPGEVCRFEAFDGSPCFPNDDDGDGEIDANCVDGDVISWCERVEAGCWDDSDCGPNQRCQIEQVTCDCADGDDCACPPIASEGICIDEQTRPTCSTNSDCGANEQCVIQESAVCPPCAFIDENGDGENDIACDCLPEWGYCEAIEGRGCYSDAQCADGLICQGASICENDGPDCFNGDVQGTCQMPERRAEPKPERKYRWPQSNPEETEQEGGAFFCSATHQNTHVPAQGGALMLLLIGLVGVWRRRR